MDYKSFREQRNRRFPDRTVQDLSHSYASYPANKGVDIFVLKDLLRHENIAITITPAVISMMKRGFQQSVCWIISQNGTEIVSILDKNATLPIIMNGLFTFIYCIIL